ncbi:MULTISPECIES: hypothetical protein [unclassified Paenibacillus]|uniref:Uncharacterized protein n=2 Tax=Bacillati TaxID=1783272 RepID=A0ABW3Q3G7_9BACL|nr:MULTISPECIES: hypothetical protein [unclassified Paenibacillus]MCM3130221.1 hypothetical protein [Paenibacillus sp. MER 78]SDX71957.1 hypothetical protein SAMN05518848_112112 [Paenibacillus sp. PDC88]SFS89034.1 hypothetical protein SAMN04488601_106108 [Paenibacillus sp. 453mf]
MVFVKKVIDEALDDDIHLIDPNLGKYRLELQPILETSFTKKCCIVLLDKKIYYKSFPIPFTGSRKAIIIEDDEQKLRQLIRDEFPDHDYEIEFSKPRYKVYPECLVHSIDVLSANEIKFMTEKQLDLWQPVIEIAVSKFRDSLKGKKRKK